MCIKTADLKSIRNIHKETALELKHCPQKLTNDYFYSYMRNSPFKRNTPTTKLPTPSPPPLPLALAKHNREPHLFLRSRASTKRKPLVKNSSISTPRKSPVITVDSLISEQKNFDNFYMLKEIYSKPDYRKKYDRLFKGKLPKKYLRFDV